jgi:HPt (histidine-containing phosphotransfer) domain-containing protein
MIDWDRVTVLRDEVGADDFDEVVELFLEEVEEVTTRLSASLTKNSMEEDLHFLKGSALSFGFREFSELCQTGETLSAKGAACQVDLQRILASYTASKQQFLTKLPTAFNA